MSSIGYNDLTLNLWLIIGLSHHNMKMPYFEFFKMYAGHEIQLREKYTRSCPKKDCHAPNWPLFFATYIWGYHLISLGEKMSSWEGSQFVKCWVFRQAKHSSGYIHTCQIIDGSAGHDVVSLISHSKRFIMNGYSNRLCKWVKVIPLKTCISL